jgi:arylsulfatase A-like enzyme
MLRRTDGRLKRLIQHLKPLGYGIIVLSDHGQHDLPEAKAGEKKGGHGKDRPEDRLVPCTWA